MARKLRVEFAAAFYHVMSRGDRREDIFVEDADRELFLELLGRACAKTGWKIHAYVLMSNHYHLMLETPRANLVAGMTWLQNTYTIRFNRRHRFSGHLFQGVTRRCWLIQTKETISYSWPTTFISTRFVPDCSRKGKAFCSILGAASRITWRRGGGDRSGWKWRPFWGRTV